MKNIFRIVGVLALALFVFTGCRTGTIHNVDHSMTLKSGTSDDKIFQAIKVAGVGLGWHVTKVKDGLAEAQLNVRSHMAQVSIPYSKSGYSIKYKNSSNLHYDSSTNKIHSNYNGWVQNLDKAISLQLSLLE